MSFKEIYRKAYTRVSRALRIIDVEPESIEPGPLDVIIDCSKYVQSPANIPASDTDAVRLLAPHFVTRDEYVEHMEQVVMRDELATVSNEVTREEFDALVFALKTKISGL